ncbi:hypothetical protein GCM10007877_19050 [Marinibactrum halimedae]|uniref:Thioesterase domain-containing protein n=2 Tax=Marinibactrum halimedae TaxID=1444977 RepID=A0AA37T3Q8_9GAMM|nr:hypothetical protein GCM10007877_19050 [Marinibactrum halimedae]
MCAMVNLAETDDHFRRLSMRFTSVGRGRAEIKMPYQEDLVGNPTTGVLHGGSITALLDTCCGFAAATVLSDIGMAPTIDLRIDYLGRGEPTADIYAKSYVYRLSQSIIFTRGIAYQYPERPLASCVANFVRLEGEDFKAMSKEIREYLDALPEASYQDDLERIRQGPLSDKGER